MLTVNAFQFKTNWSLQSYDPFTKDWVKTYQADISESINISTNKIPRYNPIPLQLLTHLHETQL